MGSISKNCLQQLLTRIAQIKEYLVEAEITEDQAPELWRNLVEMEEIAERFHAIASKQ